MYRYILTYSHVDLVIDFSLENPCSRLGCRGDSLCNNVLNTSLPASKVEQETSKETVKLFQTLLLRNPPVAEVIVADYRDIYPSQPLPLEALEGPKYLFSASFKPGQPTDDASDAHSPDIS